MRLLALVLALLSLAACDANDQGKPPRPMGNFAMGLNIVVAPKMQTLPISRQATPDEWKAAMTEAMKERFGGYSGDKLFDFGISIDGYMLAPPGVPVVASPRSALIIRVTVWDDAKQQILEEGGHQITVIEGMSADSVIGSGWTQNKDQQMKKLATNAAKAVQDYMLDHPEWLGLPPKGTKPDAAAAEDPDAPAPPTEGLAATPPPPRPVITP